MLFLVLPAMPTQTVSMGTKGTQPARDWTAADTCTNCVKNLPQKWDPIPFLGEPAVGPGRLAVHLTKMGDVE